MPIRHVSRHNLDMDRAQAVRSPLDQLEAQVNLVVRIPGIAAVNTIANRANLPRLE